MHPAELKQRRIEEVRKWFIGNGQDQKDELGDQSEVIFEAKTRYLIEHHMLKWAHGISRATAADDLLKKIDFRIRATVRNNDWSIAEFSIPIQVKSSPKSAEQFIVENGKDVHVVVAYPSLKLRDLKNTLFIIYRKETRRLQLTQ
ncbi:MAG TPA: hypothetical protein VL335_01945 [Candidatus Paceibacterota bacterium]|jgi:hypothetical protein|nr:hypothetical protein [Candidatus Paceibacterota bacterium]